MMESRRVRRAMVSALGALLLCGPAGAADEPQRPPTSREAGRAAAEPAERGDDGRERLSIYVPPTPRGSARRKSGGGTRSEGDLPYLELLAPKDHEGLSADPQPTLYWYLDAPTALRVEFTLIDDRSEQPIVERTLEGPFEAGVHAVELGELGASLREGTRYVWFVSLVPDPERRSHDRSVGAPIRFRAAPGSDFEALGRAGRWYDALAGVSQAIDAGRDLGAVRADMLRAEGLDVVAGHAGAW